MYSTETFNVGHLHRIKTGIWCVVNRFVLILVYMDSLQKSEIPMKSTQNQSMEILEE